jgi:hypothetical protein
VKPRIPTSKSERNSHLPKIHKISPIHYLLLKEFTSESPKGPHLWEPFGYYFLESLRLYAFTFFAILATVLAKVVICAFRAAIKVAT